MRVLPTLSGVLTDLRFCFGSVLPRVPTIICHNRVDFGWDFAFMPYAQEWKDTRRAFSQHFRQTAVGQYRSVEIKHTRALLLELVERPDDFYDLIRL